MLKSHMESVSNSTRGVYYLLLALFIFTSINALLKGCDQIYAAPQAVFFRNFFAIIPCLFLVPRYGGWQQLQVNNKMILFILGVMGAVSLGLLFESVVLLPFADATVFMFTASLFVTALSSLIINLFGALAALVFLPFAWQQPTLKDGIYLIILGVGGGIGQYFLVEAYRFASAGVLGPVLYSSMIWSFLYGVIFFDEIPTKTLYAGGSLIIAAGLFVIYQQNYKRKTFCA